MRFGLGQWAKKLEVLCGPKLEIPSPSKVEAKYGIKVKLPSGELLRAKAFSSAVSNECRAGELVVPVNPVSAYRRMGA
jgi:hypothetical protein